MAKLRAILTVYGNRDIFQCHLRSISETHNAVKNPVHTIALALMRLARMISIPHHGCSASPVIPEAANRNVSS
jgi:hypothetical protein